MSEQQARTEREQQIISIMQDSSAYHEIALQGRPCPAFPALTAASSDAEIEQAITAYYQQVRQQLLTQHPETAAKADLEQVETCIRLIYKLYAQAYVNGARERQRISEGVAVR